MLDIAALCLVVTAVFAYLNLRLAALPTTIGVMAAAFALSLGLLGLGHLGVAEDVRAFQHRVVGAIDFSSVLMQGMLSFLLFAGAMQVDLPTLRRFQGTVALLSVAGTALSTLMLGALLAWALPRVGVAIAPAWCFVFGALISPTDPVAVMAIVRTAGAPKDLEQVIAGESLFNDGVGIVAFVVLLGLLPAQGPDAAAAAAAATPTAAGVGRLLLQQAGGGLALGAALGWATSRAVRSIDRAEVAVLLTLAAVTGGYALADHLGASGPLAMVVAGLLVGHAQRQAGREHDPVEVFWHLVDEILNAVLFMLVGLEASVLAGGTWHAGAVVLAIAATLGVRWLTAGLPVALATALQRERARLPRGAGTVLTWGGLRGGISIAMALSLPAGPERDVLLSMTYAVVVFAILVQGLTIGRVVRACVGARPGA